MTEFKTGDRVRFIYLNQYNNEGTVIDASLSYNKMITVEWNSGSRGYYHPDSLVLSTGIGAPLQRGYKL